MSPEREPLLNKDNKEKEQAIKRAQIMCSHFLIIPMIVLFYFPAEIMVYIINEWTQHTVREQQFWNISMVTKSSPCEDKNKTDDTSSEYRHVERVTSRWLLYNKLAEMIPLIFVNMILPSYSDTYGRKFVFIVAMTGLFLKDLLVTLTVYFNLPISTIVLAYLVEGLTGGSTAILCMSFAFIADLTITDRSRVLGIVAMEMIFLLASVCPGFIAGFIIQSPNLGYSWSAVICTCVMSIALIIAIFFLPETFPRERRTKPKPVLSTMKRTFDFYASRDFKDKRMFYILLLIAYALYYVSTGNRSTMETLYFLDQPFCWNSISLGYFTLARQCAKAVLGSLSLPILQMCLSNETILILSATFLLASYVVEGLASTAILVYTSAVIASFSFLCVPLIRGIVSTMTGSDRQGSLFASLGVVSEASSLVADFTSNLVYNATVSVMDGFVFLVMAGICVLEVILFMIFCCKRQNIKTNDIESVNR